jgi:hypothetical protein
MQFVMQPGMVYQFPSGGLHSCWWVCFEVDLAGRFGAGIPHRSLEGRIVDAAGTSMNWRPAAFASVAVRQRVVTKGAIGSISIGHLPVTELGTEEPEHIRIAGDIILAKPTSRFASLRPERRQ